MPNYSFQCSKNHIFESNVSYEQMKLGVQCQFSNGKKCKAKAKQIYLSSYQRRLATNFSPGLYFLNSNGDVITPGRNDINQLPKSYLNQIKKQGFKQVNIENLNQYSKFINEVYEKQKQKELLYNSTEQFYYNNAINEQIHQLKSGGDIEFPNPDGSVRTVRIPPLNEMHPKARAFAEYSIKKALEFKYTSKGSQPFIGCMEYDNQLPNSDIDSQRYRDKDTNWQQRNR